MSCPKHDAEGFLFMQTESPFKDIVGALDTNFGSDILTVLCRRTEITHQNTAADLLLFGRDVRPLKAVFLLVG